MIERTFQPLCGRRLAALENWRRVRRLWSWTGRRESDRQTIRLLDHYSVGAPISALARAMLGHPQGAGRLRRRSAEAIVAPLLAIAYPGQEHCALSLASGTGPLLPEFRAYLRELSIDQHFELAEHWIAILRCERDDEPPAWQSTLAGPVRSFAIQRDCGGQS